MARGHSARAATYFSRNDTISSTVRRSLLSSTCLKLCRSSSYSVPSDEATMLAARGQLYSSASSPKQFSGPSSATSASLTMTLNVPLLMT